MEDFTDLSLELSDNYYNDEIEYSLYQVTWFDVWENCVLESIESVFGSLYKACICCIVFGIITSFNLPGKYFHILSILCGIYLLNSTIQSKRALITLFILILLIYLIVQITKAVQKHVRNSILSSIDISSFIQYIIIIIFILCEYTLLNQTEWLEIRGPMMVFSMKLISLITDRYVEQLETINILEYFGYILSPGNVLFGPWITFDHYLLQRNCQAKKGIYWIFGIIRALILSLVFLSISNCWASYFIPENSNRWLIGYKEALSFRTSHYFISYISEALILSTGFKNNKQHFNDKSWSFSIVSPLEIEYPSDLATVVKCWNKPMHEFFKKYVYKKWLHLGKLYAIFFTFLISALFHGLDIRIMTILICLGLFSYLEILVREYISSVFNICITVYPCTTCHHSIKRNRIICRICLFICSLFAVFHLMFLGMLMDDTTNEISIYTKWSEFYFLSFWIVAIKVLIIS